MVNKELPSYYKYWGKARKRDDGSYDYHLLVYHCLDVAAVGNALLKDNPNLLNSIKDLLTPIEIKFDALILLLLAIHDVGKFSKTFQSKITEVQFELQGCKRGFPGPIRHDSLSYTLWDKKYSQFFSNPNDVLAGAEIIDLLQIFINTATGHHGKPAISENINIKDYFDDYDLDSFEQFISDLLELFEIDIFDNTDCLKVLSSNYEALKTVSWELAGFITFSDWIGSNQEYFIPNKNPESLAEYWTESVRNAERTIQKLGLCKAAVIEKYSFQELLPDISKSPTPLQSYCNLCKLPDTPQLWILEDVTGAGKTESALILTARLLSKQLGNGVFIALPTMATSDAMYKRISLQYSKLFSKNSKPSLVLAHGARHLSNTFQESFLTFQIEEDENSNEKEASAALCNRWFADTNKKALLADAGVGTIDQVLIGVLPARHQALRLLGLKGKVLIVDEVHAYDSYQHRLLCGLLEYHSRNGGSAILLSATLPKRVRESLACAYLKGKGRRLPVILKNDNYPLATCIGNGMEVSENEQDTRVDLKRTVTVQFESEYSKIPEKLIKEAQNGKCCCWIRNTVTDAVQSYNEITEIYPKELVTLLHSRFTYADRMRKESELLNNFGPHSGASQRKGRIVIATQVIEQSLDVDFDVLVSDLAPIDYIMQRLGRLYRHKRDYNGDRCELDRRGTPTLIIYGPVPVAKPVETWYSEILRGAAFVYRDHAVLWKTQQVIINAGNKITTPGTIETPDGIRNLMNKVYGDESIETPSALQKKEDEASGKDGAGDSMGRFNLLNLSEGYSTQSSHQWYEEIQVKTRMGDVQVTVYLAKIENKTLIPFECGEYPWDQSAVKVRESLIKNIKYENNIETMVSELKEGSKRFYKGDCILPLRNEHGTWKIDAELERKGPCRLVYSKEKGLEVVRC